MEVSIMQELMAVITIHSRNSFRRAKFEDSSKYTSVIVRYYYPANVYGCIFFDDNDCNVNVQGKSKL